MAPKNRIRDFLELARPFTLVAPALGMLSGALTAYGVAPRYSYRNDSLWSWTVDVALGTLGAAVLNAASNTLNQVYDLEIDRINKPERMLPSGRMSTRTALAASVVWYVLSLLLAAAVNLECLAMFALAALATVLYSVPPFRFKRFGWGANLIIAVPRGVLLKVAGWSVTRSIWHPEAWLIGSIFGLFLLGATTSKDFADMEGDSANGCRTLPLRYGKDRAIRLLYPFYTLPFLFLGVGSVLGIYTGAAWVLILLSLLCAAWGFHVVRLLARDPAERLTENHPSWSHMYFLMFALQVGLAVAYLV